MAVSDRQRVELFHLLFLRQLSTGADRTRFSVKGGCNLRFFFGSIRYSEDLDLDVLEMPRGTLKNKVDRLLEAPALLLPLRAQGIAVEDVSAPKQTDTTQRWKLGLRRPGGSVPLRTKVEFSRRGAETDRERAAEPIDAAVARAHGIPPPVLQHYLAPAALRQKIQALLGRPQTQARDLFDLQLLRARMPQLPQLDSDLRSRLPGAIERALSLSYDDYLGQVVAFLDPEQGTPFRDRAAWDAMQLQVVELLEELGR
ncbi:MAG TPA: nucleotidyl transferase AbiEii/AbiGii toxin family protein [Myxococcaceae bacterium]|nr:nucleotidyl transferase AbiEii/AbiGii toxin family protein [Myxococcaceae bacterium]